MLDKVTLIRKRLEEAFHPTFLEVLDESEAHHGHVGYQGGGRHFAITIGAKSLNELNRVDAHRRIYALFNDLMPKEIHALRINLRRE